MKMLRAFMVTALVVAVSTGAASAQATYDWTDASILGSDYSDAANWSAGGPPLVLDTAQWGVAPVATNSVTFIAPALSSVAKIGNATVDFALGGNTYTLDDTWQDAAQTIPGTKMELKMGLAVGDVSNLTLTGGKVTCANSIVVGNFAGAGASTLTVGTGATFEVHGAYAYPAPGCVWIGGESDGHLKVENAGTVNFVDPVAGGSYVWLGGHSAHNGCTAASIIVDGPGSTVNVGLSLAIGMGGNCASTLSLTNGGQLTTPGGNQGWGNAAGDLTTILIDGTNSKLYTGNFGLGTDTLGAPGEVNTFDISNGGELVYIGASNGHTGIHANTVFNIGVNGAGTANFGRFELHDNAHLTVGQYANFSPNLHYCRLNENSTLTFVQGASVTLGSYGIFVASDNGRVEGDVDAVHSYPGAWDVMPIEVSGTLAPGMPTGTPSDQIGQMRFEKGYLDFQKGGSNSGTAELQFCSGVAQDCSDKIVLWKMGTQGNSGTADFTNGNLDYSVIGNGGKFCPVQAGFLDFLIADTMANYGVGGSDNMHGTIFAASPVLAYTYHDGSAPAIINAADIAAKGYDPLYLGLEAIRLEWTASPADFDASGLADVTDVDIIMQGGGSDLDGDGDVDIDDQDLMIRGYMQTEYGDINLNHMVDIGDLGVLAGNWGTLVGMGWADGDFNGDGDVDIGDLGVMAGNWGYDNTGNLCSSGAGGAAAAVPEPATLCLLGLGAIALMRRRRR